MIFGKDESKTASSLTRKKRTPQAWIITVLAMCAFLLLLPAIFKLDGKQHADWQQFVGRFHPLAVHIPIGLIVLVPLLEFTGIFRPALREAAGFVLGLACAACLGTLCLGYLLAYGSGDAGLTVTRHMWGGIVLTIGMLLCFVTRPSGPAEGFASTYPVLLTCVILALLWTAHQGGSLTHGSDYLTQYMPASLKRLSSFGTVAAAAPNPNSFYARHLHPIFDSNCIACHGAGKTQGGLRLDSYGLLMQGGKDGPVIIPGNADRRMLLGRVTLPANNPHFMPAEGKPPLRPNEIAWIRAWIEQGASPTITSLAGISISEVPAESAPPPVGDYSTMMEVIRKMQHSQGAKLLPVSANPSDGLILATVDSASTFNDSQLAQFEKFAPFIVEADLARTGVTDASFDTLSRFTHLRALHLEGTAVTGNGLAKLKPLSQLTYLNLGETKVDSAALSPLKSMPGLHHIYLFNTPAQPVAASADRSEARR